MRITHEPSLQPIISFSPESRFYQKPAFLSSSGAVFRYLCLKESPAKKRSIKRLLLLLTTLLLLQPLAAREELTSPGNALTLTFDVADGIPRYALSYKGRAAVLPSRLGFELKNAPALLYHPAVGRAQQLRRDQGTRLRRNGHHPKPLQRTGRHPRTAGPHHNRPLPLL